MSEPPPKKPRKSRGCLLLFPLLAIVVGGGLSYFYFGVWKHEPSAHLHVPSGTNLALRADAVKLLTWAPVREHLWPVFLERKKDSKSEAGKRLDRVADKTGVRIPDDLRELIIASLDGRAWVLIASGKIAPGRFVAGLHQVLQEEGNQSWKLDGELLVHAGGGALGQAEDGSLVLGTNRDLAMAALPAREQDEEGPALPLPVDGALSFLVNATATSGALGKLDLRMPGLSTLNEIGQLSGVISLTKEPQLDLRIQPKQGVAAAQLAKDLSSIRGAVRLLLLAVGSDLAGAKKALSDAEIKASEDAVVLTARWPYAPLDRGVARLAELLRALPKADVL